MSYQYLDNSLKQICELNNSLKNITSKLYKKCLQLTLLNKEQCYHIEDIEKGDNLYTTIFSNKFNLKLIKDKIYFYHIDDEWNFDPLIISNEFSVQDINIAMLKCLIYELKKVENNCNLDQFEIQLSGNILYQFVDIKYLLKNKKTYYFNDILNFI